MTNTLPITSSATRTRAKRRNSGHGIRDVDLPQHRQAIPLAEVAVLFAAWNAEQDRAKDAYYDEQSLMCTRCDVRRRDTGKRLCWGCRKGQK